MNRNRNLASQRASRAKLVTEKRQEALLRDLVVYNKAQLQYGLPAVPDVDRVFLRKQKVYSFSVNTQGDNITTSLTLNSNGQYAFALAQSGSTQQGAPNAAEFSALFDQWRIKQVVCSIYPDNNSEQVPIYTVIDYDDNNALALLSDATQYGTLQVTTFGKYCERVFNPTFASAAYSGAFTSFSLAPRNAWVDVASPNVLYYGLKMIIPPTPGLVSHVRVSFKVIYQFRNNR